MDFYRLINEIDSRNSKNRHGMVLTLFSLIYLYIVLAPLCLSSSFRLVFDGEGGCLRLIEIFFVFSTKIYIKKSNKTIFI